MQTLEYRHVDKSEWAAGPWQLEPDKIQFADPATGLPCLAVRHPSLGHWCGYVGVAEGHPFFEMGYSQCSQGCEDSCYETRHSPDSTVDVHGGLTFAAACRDGQEETGICHIPDPGEPERVWWFGFDCAHLNDLSPGMRRYRESSSDDTYRTLAYVQAQCADLAKQLAEIQPTQPPRPAGPPERMEEEPK